MPAPQGRKRRLMGEINVVPYIDVMLVLLIIFMVTAPMLTQGVKVELPQAAAEPIPVQNREDLQPVIVSIDHEARVFLNLAPQPDAPLDADALLDGVRTALAGNPQRDVLVKADTRVAYGRVVETMVLLQRAGATKVGFLTDPVPEPPGRRK
ncbi:MAG: protein TolR [Steroidobacteraceae bacterium]